MTSDNKKPAANSPVPSKADQPFFDNDDFDQIDALQPFDGDEVVAETQVASLDAIGNLAAEVQRAAKQGVSIASTLIEPLRLAHRVELEFQNGVQAEHLTKTVTVIGRAQGGADVVVPDDGLVSRQHAAIIWSQGEFFLEDLQSKNGTFVNGQRISSTVKLAPMQPFQFGSYVARLRICAK
jgi:pSer/pThr/pTyr-binding forkhead associated (FHA) protein